MDLNGDDSTDEEDEGGEEEPQQPRVSAAAQFQPRHVPRPPPPASERPPLPQPPLPHPPAPEPPAPALPAAATRSEPAAEGSGVEVMLHTSLVARYADLPAHLAAANVGAGQSSDGPLSSLSVHWMADGRRRRLPRVATALESAELMRMAAESRLLPHLQAAQAAASGWTSGCTMSLIVVGKATPGLERTLDGVQLTLGLTARRVLNALELANLLAAHTTAIASQHAKAAKATLSAAAAPGRAELSRGEGGADASAAPDFLAGLTAHDVLHNRSVPRSLHASWRGALCQILPQSAANAVHEAHPSFRRLYDHLLEAQRAAAAGSGRPVESALAELRVAGGKRLGPARSRKLIKIIMATREQAFERL